MFSLNHRGIREHSAQVEIKIPSMKLINTET